jgi:putative membrane protein insertion efficiency factor
VSYAAENATPVVPPLDDSVAISTADGIRGIARATAALLVTLIGIYRYLISPLLGPSCRFSPSCSAYAVQAIRRHGPLRGMRRALLRLARCNPLCDGGYDPVR